MIQSTIVEGKYRNGSIPDCAVAVVYSADNLQQFNHMAHATEKRVKDSWYLYWKSWREDSRKTLLQLRIYRDLAKSVWQVIMYYFSTISRISIGQALHRYRRLCTLDIAVGLSPLLPSGWTTGQHTFPQPVQFYLPCVHMPFAFLVIAPASQTSAHFPHWG